MLAAVALLVIGQPAMADELSVDSDVLTAGVQNPVVNLTATPGQVQDVPVDLFVSCKTQKHIGGTVTVTMDSGASTVPSGGTMTTAGTTIARPANWPADNAECGAVTNTGTGRAVLRVGAPAVAGTYTYKVRWSVSDEDARNGVSNADVTIKVTVTAPAADTTPPVITRVVSGTQGSNGWYTSNVTVAWSVTDPESGVVIDSGCGVQSFVDETTAASSSCTAHSAGGSASSVASFKIDKTGPTAALSPSGTLGQNLWYTSAVTLHASGQDAVSGGVTCTADQTQTAETTGATFTASCTNAAGLSTPTNAVTVKLDKTGPSASLAVTGGTAGANGWYTSDVTVHAAGSDPVSGGVTCTPDRTLSTDTSGTPVTGSCTNAAGLATTASPLTVRLDKTDPEAELSVTAGTLGANSWYVDDVMLHASGKDNVSDPTTCDPDQHQTTDTPGHLFTAQCTNNAGRTHDAVPVNIERDASPPTARLEVVAGTPGNGDWYTSAVTVRTVGADETSGVTCSLDQVLTAETTGTTVTGFCVNGAGLRTNAAPIGIKIDTTGPTAVTAVSAGKPGADGWYTSDVTLHTNGSDSVSGGVSCEADQQQTAETTGRAFTGTCTNAAGLSTVSAPVIVKLDKSGPSAALTPSGTLGQNAWYIADVTVSTSGQDGVSGVVGCSPVQHQTHETTGTEFEGFCTNGAGLSSDAATLTVKVDKTGPVATLSVTSPTVTSNGWYTSDVTVHTDGSDDVSGPVTCSADQTLATDTAGTDVDGSCTNEAGLSTDAASLRVKLDKSNPSASLSVSKGKLGSDGWYVDDVTVHTSGGDNVSDPTDCTPDQHLTSDSDGTVFHGSCTNSANLTQGAEPLTVKRDASSPTARLVVSGTNGANGWYTSDVTVTVKGADPTSGVHCQGGATLIRETSGLEVTGSCTNGAGLTTPADPITIKIDKTAPTAALAVTAGTSGDNGWYTSDVTVSTSGDDSVSGVVTCTAPQHQTEETVGAPFAGTCTNAAGLVGHAGPLTVKLDKTAPATRLTVTDGREGSHGWYTSDATVHTAGSDSISGVGPCTGDQFQTTETAGRVFTGTCRNGAGLTGGDELTVKLDKSGPSAELSTGGRTGANGWFIDDVTVSTNGTDDISAPVDCTGVQRQTTETTGTPFEGWCTNDAGLSTDARPITVRLDKTAPSARLKPSGSEGANQWFVDDVTVRTDGSDDVSDPVTCSRDQALTTDTAGTEVHGSCANAAGLIGQADPITVRLDKSNPSAELSVTKGTLGANKWYLDDVTVHTSGSDNVSDPTRCTEDQFQTADTDAAGHDFGGSCTNDAGRTQQAYPLNVKRDASPPTAHLDVVSGEKGAHGWYTSAVTVRTVGSDAQSGATCTPDVPLTRDTAGTTVTGSCTNGAGVTTPAEPLLIKIDTTAPSAVLAVTAGTLGSGGWYTSDVKVSTSGGDGVSGPVSCSADRYQLIETTGETFSGHCTNDAGLVSEATPLTVKLDKTAPSASLGVTGGTAGTNGWYVTDVTVTTSGADPVSGTPTCSAPQTVSGDTTGTVVRGSCTNGAGLTGAADPLTVKLDKTAPVVTVAYLDASYAIGAVPSPRCTTSDATSGVAAQATPSVPVLSAIGTYPVTCGGATDNAGNAGSATGTLRAIYRYDGFLQPVNDTAHQVGASTSIFKAGSTVPVKLQLKRADGSVVAPGSSPQWLTPVMGSVTTAAVDESVYTETATSGSTYRYDTTTQQWIYNWSTKGLAAGKYYRIGVKLDDGQTYYVSVGLR